jgi:hypothetical protein
MKRKEKYKKPPKYILVINSIKKQIFENPFFKRIKFSEERRAFTLENASSKKIILEGLASTALPRIFWPTYVYERNIYSGSTGVKNSFEGLKRGELVHQQMRDYINMKEEYFVKKYKSKNLHSYVEKLANALTEWKLVPIEGLAELPLGDEDLKVGTALDCLCVHVETGDVILIEWKCGFDHYLIIGNDSLKGSEFLSEYSNCPLHQAFLQIAFTRYFLQRNYNVKVKKALVVNVTQNGVTPHELDSKIWSNIELLYLDFLKSKRDSKKKKKKSLTPDPNEKKKTINQKQPKLTIGKKINSNLLNKKSKILFKNGKKNKGSLKLKKTIKKKTTKPDFINNKKFLVDLTDT